MQATLPGRLFPLMVGFMCKKPIKAVVVGAGAAGMSASLFLAKAGREVTLLEAGQAIAPLLRGFNRAGLQFDTGFHHAGMMNNKGILKRYLQVLGIWEKLSLSPYRVESHQLFRFIEKGFSEDYCLPQGVLKVSQFLSRHWPEHKLKIDEFYQSVDQEYQYSPFTSPEVSNFSSFSLPPVYKTEDYTGIKHLPERLKSLLLYSSLYYGVEPSQTTFDNFSLICRSCIEGVHEIKGGGRALVRAFEQELQNKQVEIRANSAVTGINLNSEGGVESVVLGNGELVFCDECVFTGHPAQLRSLLPPKALRLSNSTHLNSLKDTPHIFLLFASTRQNFVSGRHMLICPNDKLKATFEPAQFAQSWISVSCSQPNEQGIYPIVITTILPNELADELKACYAKKLNTQPKHMVSGNKSYLELKDMLTQKLLHKVKQHVPELFDIEVHCSATNTTMQNWVYGSTGSVYGAQHSVSQLPVSPRTKIPGLVLAGQGIILPGLLGTIISAAVATGLLAGFDNFFEELKWANAG